MRIGELKKVLPVIMESGEVPMLVGHAGVGKTETMKEIAKETGRELIVLTLSQLEPGDLIGLPMLDKENNQTIWAKPDWWPKEPNKTIILFDEFNRSHPLVRSAVMQLILDKKLHTHALPEGTWIAAAINPSTEDYEVEDIFDKAMIDRFVWIRVSNNIEDWMNYMTQIAQDEELMYATAVESLYNETREGFQIESNYNLPKLEPTPRAHRRLAKLYKAFKKRFGTDFEEIFREVALGVVGSIANQILAKLKELDAEKFTIEDLMKGDIEKAKKTTPMARINALRLWCKRFVELAQSKNVKLDAIRKEATNVAKVVDEAYKMEEAGILMRTLIVPQDIRSKVFPLRKKLGSSHPLNELIKKLVTADGSIDEITALKKFA